MENIKWQDKENIQKEKLVKNDLHNENRKKISIFSHKENIFFWTKRFQLYIKKKIIIINDDENKIKMYIYSIRKEKKTIKNTYNKKIRKMRSFVVWLSHIKYFRTAEMSMALMDFSLKCSRCWCNFNSIDYCQFR